MPNLDDKKRIKGLRPHEVSLVGRPANKRRALLFKSAKAVDAPADDIQMSEQERVVYFEKMRAMPDELKARANRAVRQLAEVRKAADGDKEVDQQAVDNLWDGSTQSIMAGVGRIASQLVGKVELDDWIYLLQQVGFAEDVDAEDSDASGDNAGEQQENEIGGGYVVVKDSDNPSNKEEHMAKDWEKPEGVDQKTHDQAMSAAKALYNSKVKGDAGKKEKDDAEDDEEEEMDKSKKTKSASVPEGYQEVLKAQKMLEEQNRKLIEKNERMEAQLAEHTDFRVTKSIKDQLDTELRNIGGDQAKVIRVIKHMRGQEDKTLEQDLMQILKAANEQLGNGSSYQAVGSNAQSNDGASALQKIEQLVDGMVQKSAGKMTRTSAYDHVMGTDEGRALYAQHITEKGQR